MALQALEAFVLHACDEDLVVHQLTGRRARVGVVDDFAGRFADQFRSVPGFLEAVVQVRCY